MAISLAKGSHIVGIMGPDGGLKHVLTQGRLVHFLGDELDCLQLQVKCAMSAPVVAVQSTMMTYEAFSIMGERGISSICIVDQDGEILHVTDPPRPEAHINGTLPVGDTTCSQTPLPEPNKQRKAQGAGGTKCLVLKAPRL